MSCPHPRKGWGGAQRQEPGIWRHTHAPTPRGSPVRRGAARRPGGGSPRGPVGGGTPGSGRSRGEHRSRPPAPPPNAPRPRATHRPQRRAAGRPTGARAASGAAEARESSRGCRDAGSPAKSTRAGGRTGGQTQGPRRRASLHSSPSRPAGFARLRPAASAPRAGGMSVGRRGEDSTEGVRGGQGASPAELFPS